MPESVDRTAVSSQLRAMMGRVFGVDPASIQETSTPEDIERWDSLSMLTVLIGVERKFGAVIPPEALDGTNTVGDVVDVVVTHLP